MLNAEKYKDEILEISNEGISYAVDKTKNKVVKCKGFCCDDCIFGDYGCSYKNRMSWLLSEYKEQPILEDVEKEYLSAVIKPFRNRVRSIKKYYPHIFVGVIEIKTNSLVSGCYETMQFPTFKRETMYKNMELDKEYTLEELGL